MNKHILVFMFCSLATGCASTKVFMGSYDSVKITVSDNQAQMSAENFPYEVQSSGGKVEKKIFDKPVFIEKADNDSYGNDNFKGELHVNIVCSDENLTREFSKYFCKGGFTIGKRFHKPGKESTVISEVTIYPKRKDRNHSNCEYHLITFKTTGELNRGTHRVQVKGPLAFVFLSETVSADTEEIKLFITHSEYIKDSKLAIKDKTAVTPFNANIQIVSEIISTTKKPIKIIFTKIS